MAISLPTIVARISLDDSELDRGTSKLGGMGKAAAAGLAVAGAAAVAVGVKGAQAAAEVEKGLAEVLTLNKGLEAGSAEAAAAMQHLQGETAKLSNEFGVAQAELTGGLYSAISAGVPEDNAFEFLATASKFAIAGVTDVETSVDGLTTAINAFGLDVADADKVAASLFTGVQDGKTTVEELSSSLFQVAPAAAAAGVTLEETVAAVAALTAGGTPTSVATTQIRQAISELNDPARKAAQAFEELSGTSFREFTEAGGTLEDALGMLNAEAERTGAQIGEYFGSVEASSAATTLAGEGAEAYAQNLANQGAAAQDAAGVIDNAYQHIDESASRSWERARLAGENALIRVGEVTAPLLADIADRLVPAIGRLADGFEVALAWVQANGPRVVTIVSRIAAVVGTVLLPVMVRYAVTSVAAWVRSGIAAVRAAITHTIQSYRIVAGWLRMGAAAVLQAARVVGAWVLMGVQSLVQAGRMALAWVIAMGPVGWVIAAVVALAALIIANWDRIVEWTRNLAERVSGWLSSMRERATAIVENLRDRIVGAWTALRDRVVQRVTMLRDRAVERVTSMRDRAVAIVTGLRDRVVALWTALRDRVVGFVTSMRDRVVTAVTSLRDRVVSAFTNARERAAAAMQLARTLVVAAVTAMRDNVRERIERVVTFFRELPGRIIGAIPNPLTMLRDVGSKIISGLASGITGAIGKVTDAMGRVTERVREFLPWSPAKRGPLRRYPPERGGANIARAVAAGISANVASVDAASHELAEAALLDGLPAFARTGTRRRTTTAAAGAGGRLAAGVNIEAVNVQRADPFEVADELAWRVRTSHA